MYNKKYKMPTKSNLKGRSSTISNAFAMSITPYIYPTEEEVELLNRSLDIEDGQCVYCLGEGNGRDHLKPLVRNSMPTGYITDIHNLVPCCQACNSSKGAKTFNDWYLSPYNIKRLKNKGMTDSQIEHRYELITKYESKIPKPLDYESLVGKELWDEYNARRINLIEQLNENQEFCDELYKLIMEKYKPQDTFK